MDCHSCGGKIEANQLSRRKVRIGEEHGRTSGFFWQNNNQTYPSSYHGKTTSGIYHYVPMCPDCAASYDRAQYIKNVRIAAGVAIAAILFFAIWLSGSGGDNGSGDSTNESRKAITGERPPSKRQSTDRMTAGGGAAQKEARYITMPSLAGLSIDKAKSALSDNGIPIGNIETDPDTTSTLSDGSPYVLDQSVAPGSKINIKNMAPVDITVSSGADASPDVQEEQTNVNCGSNAYYVQGQCECEDGFVPASDLRGCVENNSAPTSNCVENSHYDQDAKVCYCDEGFVISGDGSECVKPDPLPGR